MRQRPRAHRHRPRGLGRTRAAAPPRGVAPRRARPHRRGGSLLVARGRTASGGAGMGRAFATPRGGGERSAAKPCAQRCAAVRAARSGALLRRCRGRGPFGAALPARPCPRLVSARPRRAPAARSPCSGLAASHLPAPASGGFGTAPPPPPPRRSVRTAPRSDPPRRSGRTAPRSDPPRRCGRTAYGPTPAGAADGPRGRCLMPPSRCHEVGRW